MNTPTTDAGKALLDRLALPWTPDMEPGYEGMVAGWRPAVIAIEAEAAAAERARIAERVRALPHDEWARSDGRPDRLDRAAVLAAIEGASK